MQTEIINQYESKLHSQILKLCHSMELSLHDNVFGSKVYTNYQQIGLIILLMRSRKSLRDFVFELKESLWPKWLGLKELASKSSLNRWIKKFDLNKLRSLLAQTVIDEKSAVMAIDATGFDSWARSRHYNKRLKEFNVRKPHLPYNKVDLLVDTDTKLIHDFVLRTKPRHDTLGAITIIKRFKQKDVLILADKGYDSEPLHELVANSGNLMYAPIRDFSVKRPKGRHRKRCEEKHELYGMRNIVESVNFSLKSRFRSLRCKLHYMKKREFAWKVITYNLEKLSQNAKTLLYLLWRAIIWDRAKKRKSL
jgi:hypothetical protein